MFVYQRAVLLAGEDGAHTADGSEIRRSPHHLIGIFIYFFTAFSEPSTVCHQHFSNFEKHKNSIFRIMHQVEVSERQKAIIWVPPVIHLQAHIMWIGMDVMSHVSPRTFLATHGIPKSPKIWRLASKNTSTTNLLVFSRKLTLRIWSCK